MIVELRARATRERRQTLSKLVPFAEELPEPVAGEPGEA